MKLSAPIYRLKREAKIISRNDGIPLHEALDRIAAREGFKSWSLLAVKLAESAPTVKLYGQLRPGEIVLLGARPGHGKTLMSLELVGEFLKAGKQAVFFSLESTYRECMDRFASIGVDIDSFAELFEFDGSDRIDANYIKEKLAAAPRGTLAVVDYLQLLDQRRESPELMVQVAALRLFAIEKGMILVFISQVDRSYDPAKKPFPGLEDVRLPNPLDLTLFDRTCFLNNGEVQYAGVR